MVNILFYNHPFHIFPENTQRRCLFGLPNNKEAQRQTHKALAAYWCVHGANLFSAGKSIWVS